VSTAIAMGVTSEEMQAAGIPGTKEPVYEALSVQETIRRHHDSLVRFLRQRLRVKEDAVDIAQEAYIRMMQYEGSSKIHSPGSMLFRIAINIANDLGRADAVRRVSEQVPIDGLELASTQPSADRQIAASQDLQILYRAIEQLPPKCRQVFLLSRAQRMTYPQIAAHCGISVKMVEKHIGHALAICMKKVGGGGETPS
jgi:RNA polymerase sigma factor (sigma-70 family)